ncbi:MAG: PKD domain-containing protein [Cyclobacteriaceae bacterium]
MCSIIGIITIFSLYKGPIQLDKPISETSSLKESAIISSEQEILQNQVASSAEVLFSNRQPKEPITKRVSNQKELVKAVSIKDLSEIKTKAGFFVNKGQFKDDDIKYVLKRHGLRMVLRSNSLSYYLLYERHTDAGTQSFVDHIGVELIGSNPQPEIETFGESADKHNYFLGDIKATGVTHFKQVIYKDIYPGIDMLFEASAPEKDRFGAKYSFIVHPGADPSQISVSYSGQKGLSTMESTGDKHFVDIADLLTIETSGGAIGEEITSIYTVDEHNTKASVSGQFVKKDGFVAYDIPTYDQSKTLVIDPEVVTVNLNVATYFGGVEADNITDVNGDENYIYALVETKSDGYASIGAYDESLSAGEKTDILIAKFTKDLKGLEAATYFGGSETEFPTSLKISEKQIIIGGYTDSNDIHDHNEKILSNHGLNDILVAVFNKELTELELVVVSGGVKDDYLMDLEIEGNGIYTTGFTNSTGLNSLGDNYSNNLEDAFLSKYDLNDGNQSWFIYTDGLAGSAKGGGIAIGANTIYYAGSSTFRYLNVVDVDAFYVSSFDLDGNRINSKNFGEDAVNGISEISGMDLDITNDRLVISGNLTGNAIDDLSVKSQRTFGGGESDGFISSMDITTFAVDWSSYYGGSKDDYINGMSIDCNGNINIVGNSHSTENIATESGYSNINKGSLAGGDGDAFLAKFTPEGNRYWGSYFGDGNSDAANAIALSEGGNIVICGKTTSNQGIVPDGSDVYQPKPENGERGFIAIFCDILIPSPPSSKTVTYNSNVTFSVGIDYCGEDNATYSWSGPSGLISGADQADLILNNVTDADAGRYCVTVTTPCGSEEVCARLRVVSLTGNNVCLDTESKLNDTAPDQELIKLDFPDITIYEDEVATDFISNIQYKWSVFPATGANKVVDPNDRSEILILDMTDFRADFRTIYVSPEEAGKYTYSLELKYNDSRQDPVEVTDITTVDIEVYDHPTLDPVSNVVLCEGETSSITIGSDLALAKYEWELIDNAGGNISISEGNSGTESNLNATTDVFEKVFELADNVTTDQSGVLQIIPTSNNNDCLGDPIDINITVKPRANLTTDDNGQSTYCSGNEVTINFGAEGFSVTTFSWNRAAVTDVSPNTSSGEDLSAGSLIETLTNGSNSKKTVTYNISGDFNGCTSDISQSVTILPASTVNDISDQQVCNGEAFSVSITTNITDSDAIGYHIVVVEANTNISGQSDVNEAPAYDSNSPFIFSQTLTNETNSDQVLTYTVTPYQLDSKGVECPGDAKSFKTTVYPTSDIIVENIEVCESEAVNLEFSSNVDGANIAYEMSLDAGLSYSGALIDSVQNSGQLTGFFSFSESSPTSSLSATISFTTQYSDCEGDSKDITITVQPQPDIEIAGNAIICGDTPAALVAITQLSSVVWQWNDPDGNEISGANSGNYNPSEPGTYSVKVTETNTGCTNTETVSVTKPEQIDFDPELVSSGGDDVCAEDGVELSLTITTGTPDALQWERKNADDSYEAIVGANSRILTITEGGSYRIVINPGTDCEQFSNDKEIVFSPLPDLTISADNLDLCPNDQLNLTSTITENGATISSIQWTYAPANETLQINVESGNELNPQIVFPDYTGESVIVYEVIMTVLTADGCLARDTIALTLNPNPAASFTLDNEICNGFTNSITPTTNSQRVDKLQWKVFDEKDADVTGSIVSNDTIEIPDFSFPNNFTQSTLTYRVELKVVSLPGCGSTSSQQISVLPQPEMIISGETSGCSGTTFSLYSENSSPKDGRSFQSTTWYMDGVEVSSNSTFSDILTNDDTIINLNFKIDLIGKTFTGCLDTTSTTITVYPDARAKFTPTNNLFGCAPFNIISAGGLSDAVDYPDANDPDGYIWKYYLDGSNDPIVTGTGITPPDYIIENADQTLRVELTASSLNNCADSVSAVTFTTYSDPVPDFTMAAETCSEQTVNFTDNSLLSNNDAIQENAEYTWDFGDGNTSTVREPTHSFINSSNTDPIDYTVKLTIKIGDCSKEVSKKITVNPLPKADFNIDNSCAGGKVTVANSSKGIDLEYKWTESTGQVQFDNDESENPTLTLPDNQSSDASYTIKLVAKTRGVECSDEVTQEISVSNRPVAVLGNLPDQGCDNELSVDGSGSIGQNLNYSWKVLPIGDSPFGATFNDPNAATTTLVLPQNINLGNNAYTIRLIVESEGCLDSTDHRFTLNPQPLTQFGASATEICVGTTVKFQNLSLTFVENESIADLKFEWSIDDVVQAVSRDFEFTFDVTDLTEIRTYQVSLTSESSDSCRSTFTQQIIVNPNAKSSFTIEADKGCAPFKISDRNNILLTEFPSSNGSYLWRIVDLNDNELLRSEGNTPPDYEITEPNTSVILELIAIPNATGCKSDTTEQIFTTYEESTANFILNEDAVCEDAVIALSDDLTTNADSVVWNFGDGSAFLLGTGISVEHSFINYSFTKDTIYQITQYTYSENDCADSTSLDITVHPKPNALFTLQNACGGDTVTVNNLSEGKGDLRYQWSTDPQTDIVVLGADQSNPRFVINSENQSDIQFDITLIVTSEDNCQQTYSKELIIFGDPVAKISGSAIVCNGSEEIFTSVLPETSSSLAPDSLYIWNFGDGTIDTVKAPIRAKAHTYLDTGQFVITLGVLNLGGCYDVDSMSVRVIAIPEAKFVKTLRSYNASGSVLNDSIVGEDNDRICGPRVIMTIENLSFDYEAGETYQWDFGRGQNDILMGKQPGEIVFAQNDYKDTTYQVSLTVTNQCGSSTYNDEVTIIPSPVADFTFDWDYGCDEVPAVIINNSRGLPSKYYFDFGDGSPIFSTTDSQPIGHIFDNTGSSDTTYFISLIAENECGIDTLTKAFTIIPNDIRASASIGAADNHFCVGEEITVRANGVNNENADILWLTSDGRIFQDEQEVSLTFDKAGSYSIYLDVFVPLCNNSAKDTIDIVIETGPVLDFEVTESVCFGDSVKITNISVEQSSSTIWSLGDGTGFVGIEPPNKVYAESGFYNIQMMLRGENNCETNLTKEVSVAPFIEPEMSVTENISCQGYKYEFMIDNQTEIPEGYETTYIWSLNDSIVGRGFVLDPIILFADSLSEKKYDLVFQMSFGECLASWSQPLNTAVFEADIEIKAADNYICMGDTITFESLGTKDPNAQITWDFGDGGVVLNNLTASYAYTSAGSYEVILSMFIPECEITARDTFNIIVEQGPDISFQAPISACLGEVITIQNNGLIKSDQTIWDLGDGRLKNGLTPGIFSFSSVGDYQIEMKLTGANGCVSTTSKIISIKDNPLIDFEIDELVCEGVPVSFNNLTTGAKSYRWYIHELGDTTLATNFNRVITTIGNYHITLEAYTDFSQKGCVQSLTKTFTVQKSPQVTINVLDDKVCQSERVKVGNNSVDNQINNWFLEDFFTGERKASLGSTNGLDSLSFEARVPGTLRVVLESYSVEGCMIIGYDTLVVYPEVLPTIDTLKDNVCGGSVYTFENLTDVPDSLNARYSWYRDSLLIGNTYNPEPQTFYGEEFITKESLISVKLEYEGCVYSETIPIEVPGLLDCNFVLPNVFSPNNDGFNDRATVIIHPNTRNNLTFLEISVYNAVENLVGKIVIKRATVADQMECIEGCDASFTAEDWYDYAGWDGNIGGAPAPRGAYMLKVATDCCSADPRAKTGLIQLIK